MERTHKQIRLGRVRNGRVVSYDLVREKRQRFESHSYPRPNQTNPATLIPLLRNRGDEEMILINSKNVQIYGNAVYLFGDLILIDMAYILLQDFFSF